MAAASPTRAPAADAPPTPGATVVRAHTVMPGLWDTHVHIMGSQSLDLARLPFEPAPLRTVRSVNDMRAALDIGVTSVRELGGLGLHLARAIAEGVIEGPTIYAAGRDPLDHRRPRRPAQLPAGLGQRVRHTTTGEARLADGPADCAKATREQLRRDAKVIKVCASGGVLSEIDHPLHQQFTGAELRAIVEVAGMADRSVAAHCHGKAGIMAALEAGVRTIEHGTYLDDECAAAMRETGAILVPTRTIVEEIRESRAAPPYAQVKLDALAETHAAMVTLAHEADVTIAMGTDIGLGVGQGPASWGRNGRELTLLAAGGLTPLEVIEAATATGPETLGRLAPRSGQLRVGYDADVVTLDVNPLADLSVFANAGHVTGVWLSGRRVRDAKNGVTG